MTEPVTVESPRDLDDLAPSNGSMGARPAHAQALASRPSSLAAVVLALIAVLARVFRLDHQSLWIDEGYSVEFSDGTDLGAVLDRLIETDLSDRFHIPFYLVLHGWRRVFGDSVSAMRSLSLVFGLGVVVVVFLTARRLFDRHAAYAAGGIVALGSYFVHYSQELRDYAAGTFLVSIMVLLFVGLITGNDRPWYPWAFALSVALGIFLNVLVLCAAAALGLVHLIEERAWRPVLKFWWPAALLSIGPLAFYLSSPVATDPSQIGVSRTTTAVPVNTAYSVFGLLFGTTYGPPQQDLRIDRTQAVKDNLLELGLAGLCGVLLLAGVVALWRGRWRVARDHRGPRIGRDRLLIILLALQIAMGTAFAWYTDLNWLPRHSFFLAPTLVLVLAALVDRAHDWRPRSRRIAIGAGGLFVVLNLWSLMNYYAVDDYSRDDFEAATEYVLAARGPETSSILMGAVGDDRLLTFYGDTGTIDGRTAGVDGAADLGAAVENVTEGAANVIVVVSREYTLGPIGIVPAKMDERYDLLDSVTFQGINIYTFELTGQEPSQ